MFISPLFQRIAISFAAITALGILVHDTKFDEAVALALPVTAITLGLGVHAFDGDSAHTHVERASVAHQYSGIPRIQPRDDHRKYYLSKRLGGTVDEFGGATVLWPSI